MLPGPVFNYELLTTARRGRYHLIRIAYALMPVLVLWLIHDIWLARSGGELSIRQIATLALMTFAIFSVYQLVMVVALTPVLVAGVIADERQRRTLDYLLASRLTSGEIVLGKLMARMVHLAVFLAVGLPVMSLLNLLGGIDPRLVVLSTAGAASTGFFVAGISILLSVLARRVGEAVAAVYALVLLWIVIPPSIEYLLPTALPELYGWLGPVNEWVDATNPFSVVLAEFLSPGGARLVERGLWMIGLQTTCGATLAILAAWRLRPIFAAQQEGRRRRPSVVRPPRRRLWPRPACGVNPMMWKELFTVRPGKVSKYIVRFAVVVFGSLIALQTFLLGVGAVLEVLEFGYRSSGLTGSWDVSRYRWHFHTFLQLLGVVLYLFWTLVVASSAAAGVTYERERDTWLSLTATTLTGPEIVNAKMAGVFWSTRWSWAGLVTLWLIGVGVGAIHPVGFALAVVELGVFLGFTVAVGTFFSLVVESTFRAQLLTFAALIMVNALGQTALFWAQGTGTPPIWPGLSPVMLSRGLMNYVEFDGLWGGPTRIPPRCISTMPPCGQSFGWT
jgi:ABC-type transport system involved in multi-copper enzyme maturation permease subunit